MDRRSFMRGAGLAGAGVLAATPLAAPAIAQENPKIRWRMSSSFPKSLDTIFGGAEDLAVHVSSATDGNFLIEPYAEGEIVPGMKVLEAVTTGKVEIAHTCAYYFADKDPAYAMATAIPFGLNGRLMNAWFYQGNGNRLLNEFFATQGLYGIPAGNTGAQMGGWYAKEINTVEDLKGLRLRIAGIAGTILAKLGVKPQQLSGSEIVPAFAKNGIDAAEWVGPHDDLKLGLQKAAKFYYYPGWWEGGPAVHALISLDKWNSLPRRYQAILADACAVTNLNMMARYDVKNPQALKRLVADGTELRPFSQDVLEACYTAALEAYADMSAASPAFKRLYEDQLSFKKDAYLWMQLSEYTFDTFMMIQQRAGKL